MYEKDINVSKKTWNKIKGHFGPHQQKFYTSIVKELPQEAVIVEIGTFHGRSTVFLAQLMQEKEKNGKIFTVDNFVAREASITKKQAHQRVMRNLKEAEVDHFVKALLSNSSDAAKDFEDESIDFLFIDGSHLFTQVVLDITSWYGKVREGGIIAGDDFSDGYPGVVRAVNQIFPKRKIYFSRLWKITKPKG